MAIQRTNYQDTLRMRYNMGPDPNDEGKDILRARSYTRIKPGTDDQDLWTLAKGFEKLFDAQLVNTYRVVHVELTENE
ncbi:MAG: DUF1659 domain-containing protein [Candidatus Contubernalis sp.]|nr:DUF1659 domain-containing protein [Candidatus Contubernalis sp.]